VNCHAYQDLLQQRLDGTPIESPALAEHLRGCAICRELETASQRLQEGLRLLAPPAPPPDWAARLADRVLLDRRRARRRARSRWTVSLALAAGLFVVLALRLDWRLKFNQAGSEEPKPSPVAKERKTPADTPTLRDSVKEAGVAMASLTNQTADETVGPTRWLLPKVSRPSLPPLDFSAIETPAAPLREAGANVSTGLEPVTTSARRAFGLFLRELPPLDSGSKGS
jgi:hypothetical protein